MIVLPPLSSSSYQSQPTRQNVPNQPNSAKPAESAPTAFEPIRIHRIISAATAASCHSPYRRSDDGAVSYVRLKFNQSQHQSPPAYQPWAPRSRRWRRQHHPTDANNNNITLKSSTNNKNNNRSNSRTEQAPPKSPANLRYTSRVIISDDFSQVDIRADEGEVEAVSREGEFCSVFIIF